MLRNARFILPALIFAVACGSSPRTVPDSNGRVTDAAQPDAPLMNHCKVQADDNAVGMCSAVAPPNSFEPALQWSWTGPDREIFSIVTPLVANLTDDNADGAIDLCDTPDVVVVAMQDAGQPRTPGHIYLLNGKTGQQELKIATTVDATVTPALGDLDHDGVALLTDDLNDTFGPA